MMPSDREAAKPELSQYGASPFATRGEHIGEYARYIVAPRPFVHALPVTTQADHGAGTGGLVAALTELRDTLADTSYALRLPSAEQAAAAGAAIVRQLDDYLLPRLSQLDAPLLVVVGGSTGAGKSTLVNSMVRAPVSPAGVLRPTTRAPVLACHPADAPWFSSAHLLPGLTRTSTKADDPRTLQIVTAPALERGLALLDAPDIDSVVDSNRALAVQLFAAADLWLFVTTAARYADAVPWDMLRDARGRGTAIAMVLDRVPGGAGEAIELHLAAMLAANDLAEVPMFVLPETQLDGQGLLPERVIAGLRDWLTGLARSAAARAEVIRQTVEGAITALETSVRRLALAADDQVTAVEALTMSVRAAYRGAQSTVEQGVHDGVLLRGEVLARWQELVGTGDLMRALQARIGRLRDRITAAITGRTVPGEKFQAALETGLVALVRSAAADAAEQAANAWRLHPAGKELLTGATAELGKPSPDLRVRRERHRPARHGQRLHRHRVHPHRDRAGGGRRHVGRRTEGARSDLRRPGRTPAGRPRPRRPARPRQGPVCRGGRPLHGGARQGRGGRGLGQAAAGGSDSGGRGAAGVAAARRRWFVTIVNRPRRSVPGMDPRALVRRIEGLRRFLGAVADHVPEQRLAGVRTVVDRAGERLALSRDYTAVALAGATGSGKSSLFNALARLGLSQVGVRRPTTGVAHACVWGRRRA